jgi:glucan phosphorylase
MASHMFNAISFLYHLFGLLKQGDKIAFVEAYDEALAHLIYAGSDIILCSSFQDPSLQIAVCETSLLFSCFFQ